MDCPWKHQTHKRMKIGVVSFIVTLHIAAVLFAGLNTTPITEPDFPNYQRVPNDSKESKNNYYSMKNYWETL